MQHFTTFIASRKHLFSRRNVAIAILFAIGLTLFASVYDGVKEKGDLASFDAPLLAWATASYNPQLAYTMRIVSDLSSPVSLSIATLVGAALWAWKKREYWRPALFVGAMTLAYGLSAIIKTATARARPTVTDLLESPAAISYSFPSGHTLGIAVFLFVLGYFFCVAKPTARRVVMWAIATAASVALVAFSRIYLGYHWLTDVSASVGLAFIVLASTIAIDTYLTSWWRRRSTSKEV